MSDHFTMVLVAGLLSTAMMLTTTYKADRNKEVLNYKDPLTGCEYLYTRNSDLTPRESGDGINQLGCYANSKGVQM